MKDGFEEFAKFVADWIFDPDNEDNFQSDAFCELVCRKLVDLGVVKKEGDKYVYGE